MMKERNFSNGDDLRDALPGLTVGTLVRFHRAVHRIIDAGSEQGHRIAALPDLGPKCNEDDPKKEAEEGGE